jgi:hypothetical protein
MMSKRTILLAVLAVIMFVAAIFSLFFEKKETETELNDLLNGSRPGDTDTTDEPTDKGSTDTDQDKV